ncbi:MAG: hypothetical protein NTY38_11880, partial [Acidobacteria bacterium]|nr:hypothetical protein [Acidobacteriota bacterium]
RKIADRGYLPRFSPDGTQIAFRGGDGKLYTVPAHGGEPRLIQTGLSMPITYPLWTPDGKRLLFVTGDEQGEFDWKTVPAEGGQATSTGAGEIFRRFGLGNHVYLPIPGDWVGDRMVFSAGKGHTCTLWRLRFSPRNWQVAGEPEQFTSGPGPDTFPRAAVDAGGRTRIVFSRENRTSNLWSLPFAETGAEQRLTYDPAVLPELSGSSPQLSSNGGLLAFVSERLGNPDVFVRDLKTQAETPVAANAWPEDSVAMCPDGSRLAYLSHNDGHASLLVWEVARTATTKLCEDCGRPVGWTPDGKGLLLDSGVSPGLRILDPATRKVRDILPGIRYRLREASVSPDGKWVAILTRSIQDGCPASFLAPLGSESTESCAGVISLDGLGVIYGANWSADGAWLYFIAAREDFRCVWKVRLDPATGRPAGEPVAVRHFHRHQKFVVAGGGLSIVGGRLAVWLGDSATSVWMAEVLGRF